MAMSSFYTKTTQGNIIHIRGNRKMSQDSLDRITNAFDLATKQAMAQIEQEQQVAYLAALKLVATVDANLSRRTVHYRRCDGRLLMKFDEWLAAVEAGEWPIEGELERAA